MGLVGVNYDARNLIILAPNPSSSIFAQFLPNPASQKRPTAEKAAALTPHTDAHAPAAQHWSLYLRGLRTPISTSIKQLEEVCACVLSVC